VFHSLRGIARGQADEAAMIYPKASPRSVQGVAFSQIYLTA
jgi:hypothetical protein